MTSEGRAWFISKVGYGLSRDGLNASSASLKNPGFIPAAAVELEEIEN